MRDLTTLEAKYLIELLWNRDTTVRALAKRRVLLPSQAQGEQRIIIGAIGKLHNHVATHS